MRQWHIKGIDTWHWGAEHREGDRVLARVAGFDMRRVIVLVLMGRFMRRELGMFVGSRPVMVLGMFVLGIRVSVQRGDIGGNGSEGEADHDGDEALHKASVWNRRLRVKPG